jgi:hypothetical protein
MGIGFNGHINYKKLTVFEFTKTFGYGSLPFPKRFYFGTFQDDARGEFLNEFVVKGRLSVFDFYVFLKLHCTAKILLL